MPEPHQPPQDGRRTIYGAGHSPHERNRTMSDTDEFPALLTAAEVARHLRLSHNAVLRLISKGELPAVRLNNGTGRPRVTVDALRQFVGAPKA